ncbi:MAG: DegV family EDD domain-containing protein [Candidatus Aminicenantes bacterium]|nr:DegV family EDD domain-containing protein [Candidatus Aminicenantes bacterium]
MKIRYLSGNRLYYAVLAGGNAVIRDQAYLNKINVFPVPDADTGTNLASTMRFIAERARASRSPKTTLDSIADAAITGARGNSGIIFAQFLYGLAQEVRNDLHLTTRAFGESVRRAVGYARSAIAHPVEGTMITLIHDWAEAVYRDRHLRSDFAELLAHSLETARASLKETTHKLAVLRKAGVVDAGAKGFVDFLEGVVHFIRRGDIKSLRMERADAAEAPPIVQAHRGEVLRRYCAEALIVGSGLDVDAIRRTVDAGGESAIVAGSAAKVRIHVHTDAPAELFFRLKDFGTIAEIKADDMVRQYEAAHAPKAKIALVTDSACDLPAAFLDEHQIHVVPYHLSFGDSLFLDKVTIAPDQFYELLQTSRHHPQSAQPSPAAVRNLMSFLAGHYESIIAVTISSGLSGMAGLCRLAADALPGAKISVIDSRHLSLSEGLILKRVAEAVRSGRPHDEIVRDARGWVAKTKLFVDIATLKYMVRGGRVSPLKGLVAGLLNLKPIVSLDAEGKAAIEGKSFSRRANLKKILGHVRAFADTGKVRGYAIVHARNPERAARYAADMTAIVGAGPDFVMEVSPVVGAHNGIGVVGIALMHE